MQAGQVLLQLPPETRNQPTRISIPRDCFETLGLPSDKTYQIMNASAEKIYGGKLLLCQAIFYCVYIYSGSKSKYFTTYMRRKQKEVSYMNEWLVIPALTVTISTLIEIKHSLV